VNVRDPSAADGSSLPFRHRRPSWLRVKVPGGAGFEGVHGVMRGHGLHTVCEEAHCPNIGECWGAGTGTFLIMGDTCTRGCGFCAVKTGRPAPLDPGEPERVAQGIRAMGLRHAVITSVNRDDLADGGASVFAECIARTRAAARECTIEVLVPDFGGHRGALQLLMASRPDVLNHNVETVPSLYPTVRPQASYARSLDVLRQAKQMDATVLTKTGIMVGLGETPDQVGGVMADLVAIGVDVLTIGQYLRPSAEHLPIARYYAPDEFASLRDQGLALGLAWVEAGPLVRSSYRAEQQVTALRQQPTGPEQGRAPLPRR
jgi:lipoic acid synthetase